MGILGIVIQARIWARRLPGKILMDLGGETVLEHIIRRCRQVAAVDQIIVATPDLALVPIIRSYGAIPFLGDNENVLRRYIQACEAFNLDACVRLTADCPFVDPGTISRLVALWNSGDYDYVSNVLERSYPMGLDCEVVSLQALRGIAKRTSEKKYLEHVTLFIREHPDQYRTANLKADADYTAFEWRLDRPEDLPYLKALYKCVGNVLYPFVDMLRLSTKDGYAERLRVPAGAGSEPGGNPPAHDGNATAADCTPDQPGPAWYERGHRVAGADPEPA